MSDDPAGPRPPSDPRLDEMVPRSEEGGHVGPEKYLPGRGQRAAAPNAEQSAEPAGLAGQDESAEPVRPGDASGDTGDAGDPGDPGGPGEIGDPEDSIPLRPFTGGRDADYVTLEDERTSSAPTSEAPTTGAPTSGAPTTRAPTTGAPLGGAPPSGMPASERRGVVPPASGRGPVDRGLADLTASQRVVPQRLVDDPSAPRAASAHPPPERRPPQRTPVTTLDVNLRPDKKNEPLRRLAILAAALSLLIGLVVFREWGNRDSTETASSDDETSVTTAAPATDGGSTDPDFLGSGDTEDSGGGDDTGTTTATASGVDASDASDADDADSDSDEGSGASDANDPDDESDEGSGASDADDAETSRTTAVPEPGVDLDAARGLLESEQITLTGVVSSQDEADALVLQMENVVGAGNVDGSALTINESAAPLEQLTLSVPDELGFTPGSDTIESSFFPVLDRLIGLFELLPSVVIAVEGHTDSSGLDYENLALSQRRAEAVVGYIVDSGVNSFRLEPQGRGSTEPIADNDTAAGRALNRRIEFIVFGLDL